MHIHSQLYYDYRHDIFRVAVYVMVNSALANLLPAKECLGKYPRVKAVYSVLIYFVALGALNVRRRLPSLGAWRVPMRCR